MATKKKPKFTKLDQRAYNAVGPYFYSTNKATVKQTLKNMAENKSYWGGDDSEAGRQTQDPYFNEMFKYALGDGELSNLQHFEESPYKPSVSADNTAEYLRLKDLNKKAFISSQQEFLKDSASNKRGITSSELYTTNPEANPDYTFGNLTMSKGKDDKGTYVSVYDKWDFANKFANKLLDRKPEMYDRVYYEQKTSDDNYDAYQAVDVTRPGRASFELAQGGKIMAKNKNRISYKNNERLYSPEMEELGLGDWIKDNSKGIVGGIKTIGGAALLATGVGGAAGIGLMASGINDIGGEISSDRATALAEESQTELQNEMEDSLKAQQLAGVKASKTQQLQQTALMNSNYAPQKMEYGGPINYTGQSHDGPQSGIPVDVQGNPVSVSKQKPVALVEGGEIAVRTEDGTPYVFSKKSGAADKANKILKKAEMRLGKDYNNPDPISKEGMQRSLKRLIASEEANKKSKNTKKLAKGGNLPQYGMSDYLEDNPEIGDFVGDTGTDTMGAASPWSSFGTQAAISGASAGLGALGNILLANNRTAPTDIPDPNPTPRVFAPKTSFVEQRLQANVDATEARARGRSQTRRAGLGKAQEQANAAYSDATITGNLGKIKSESLMKERATNLQSNLSAQSSNQQAAIADAQAQSRVDQLNAMRTDQFDQQTSQLYSQAMGNVTGGIRDIGSAYQDSQYLNTLSGRSGYQMMRDTDGKIKLMPIPGYWENKVQS